MDTTYPPVHRTQSLHPVPAAYVPPVSVDWGSWDKQPSDVSVLPAPCFSPQTSLYTGCPEVSLMRAVLEDAVACFRKPYEAERRWVQREAREAEEWLFCDDAYGLFSYVSVCTVLGLEPESTRQKLRRWSQFHSNMPQRKMQRVIVVG
jgi:hypothetical protein